MRKRLHYFLNLLLVYLFVSTVGFAQKKKLKFEDKGIGSITVVNEDIFTICPAFSYKRLGSFVALKGSEVAACALDEKENDKILGINYLDLNRGIDTTLNIVKIEETDLRKIRFQQPIKVISEDINLTEKYIIVQHEKKGLAIHSIADGTLVRYIPIPVYAEKIKYHINKSGDVLFIQDTEISGKFIDLITGDILSEVIVPEGTVLTGAFKFMSDARKYLIGFKPAPGYSKKKVKSLEGDSLAIFDPAETIRMKELFLNQTQFPIEQYKTGLVFGEVDNKTDNLPKIINDSIPEFLATRHILFAKHDSLIVTVQPNGIVMLYMLDEGDYRCVKVISDLILSRLFKGVMNLMDDKPKGIQFEASRLFKPKLSTRNVINASVSPDGEYLLLHNKTYTIDIPEKRIAIDSKTGITVMKLPTGSIEGFFSCDNMWVSVNFTNNTFDTDMHFTADGSTFFTKGRAYNFGILQKLINYQKNQSTTKTVETRFVRPVIEEQKK